MTSKIQDDLGDYDVVVIGAGIVGSMIARELSKYEGRFALVDKEPASGFGVSKGGLSLLHSPFIFPTGPVRIRLAMTGPERYRKLADELDVLLNEFDELFVALEPSQMENLEGRTQWACDNNLPLDYEMIGPEKLRTLEPHVTEKALGALWVRGLGAIYAPEWTFALIDNAVQNGLHAYFKAAVSAVGKERNSGFLVQTSRGILRARYLVNAAGIFADEIAAMLGDRDIKLTLTKAVMAILDRSVSCLVRNMVYGTFGKDHSQLVAPTAHGNVLIGLGYFTPPAHKSDTTVTREKLEEVVRMAKALVPAVSERNIITSFVGIRSENNRAGAGDFYIAPSERAPGVIHAVIGSPGLTAAPAIAELMIEKLSEAGMVMQEKKDFQPGRVGGFRFRRASDEERDRMIRSDARHGHVVCRCEHVTEGEILDVIRRGADTTDAIKHLTRAGMGLCQGGFCGTVVLDLLAKELGISPEEITKKGEGSGLVAGSIHGQ